MAHLYQAGFCVLIRQDDGVCVICKQKPPSHEVVLCNTYAPKTTSDALRFDRFPAVTVNREMTNEIEPMKEQVKVMEEKDENDPEEESRKKKTKQEEPLICVLNRQQTMEEFLQDNDVVDA